MRFIILLIFFICSLFSNTDVTLNLKWKNQFQFAGFYIAKEKGFYKTNGLNVKINEVDTIAPLDNVLKKDLVFGISDSSLIYNKMQGSPITALIALFQTSPSSLISLKNNGISSPLDLKSKIIEVTNSSEINSSIFAMLKLLGVKYIEKFPTFDIEDLISKRTDAISGYVSNEPYRLLEKGYEPVVFNPTDYGYDFYGDILFTSNETLNKYPSEVNAFVEASVLGWKYAFKHIEETVDLILKKYNTQNKTREELLYEAKSLKNFVGNLDRFGELNINKVRSIATVYNVFLQHKYNLDNLDNFIYNLNSLYLTSFHLSEINFTDEEKKYLSENKSFKVCTNSNSFPLSGYKDGKLIGVMGEVFDKISNELGVKFEALRSDEYALLSHRIKNNQCQFLDMIAVNQEIFQNLITTKKLKTSNMILIGNQYTLNFKNHDELKKLNIYTNFERYKQVLTRLHPEMNVIYEPNIEKISMYLLESSFNQYLLPIELAKNYLNINQKYHFKITRILSDVKNNIAIGVNNTNENLVNIINKVIDKFGTAYLSSVIDNYMYFINNHDIRKHKSMNLSTSELFYLKNTKFNIYFTNWEPLGYKKDDKYEGYVIEYFKELLKDYPVNVEYRLKNSFAEILSSFEKDKNALFLSTTSTPDKLKYANFSIPYDKFEIALATKNDIDYVYNFKFLEGKKIAVGKNYSAYSILKKSYPKIKFIFTKNTLEALSLVLKGEVFGAVDILPVVNNLITKYNMTNLKISGLSEELFNLQFMVNKENSELIPILNKLISDFDNKKLYELRNTLFSIKKQEKVDLTPYYVSIFVLLVIVLILITRQIVLNKSKTLIENEKLKFKSIMENASDGIHILDMNGKIVDCNKAFANSLGYSIEELKTMKVSDWDCQLDEKDLEVKIIEVMKNSQTFSTRHRKKDGTFIDVEISAKGIILEDTQHLYASSKDLSDIKKAYEKIEILNKQLNDLNKNLEIKIEEAVDENTKQQAILVHQNRLAQLGEMMSMIAHQWRQPLSAISVWVSNMLIIADNKDFKPEDLKPIESKIKDIIVHLSTTIDEFKNYYQTENRKKEFELESNINGSLKLLNNYIEQNKIELNKQNIENIKLYSYENLLKQVIVAIVSNAIDAIRNVENKKIEIVSKIDEQNVKIYISDNGIGIKKEIQGNVFDPYFTTKKELNGTGLGLYMSKMIVEKSFKGDLSFTTSPAGTTFIIVFPIVENI